MMKKTSRSGEGRSARVVELELLEKLRQRLPDDLEILQALAELYTENGQIHQGLEIDLELSRLLPHDELVWYNLGCSLSLAGKRDEAFKALSRAIELGYDDYEWMKSDRDLISLRDDPRYESLLNWIYSACEE